VSGVVNGLLGRPGSTTAGRVPAVAVVPGGSANVLARALGIAKDPVAATNQLIQLLDDYRRHQTWRRIGLIDCGDQWATVNAGMGIDAEVVAATGSLAMPSDRANTFAEPPGTTATAGTGPAGGDPGRPSRPLTTPLTVPSPPWTTTRSTPSATACCASSLP